jgi:hypothetical protein
MSTHHVFPLSLLRTVLHTVLTDAECQSVQKSTCCYEESHVAEVLQNFIAQLNTGKP